MSGGRVRKLAVLAIIGGAIAAAVKALRGEPTPVYSNHPSVNGGPTVVPASEVPPLVPAPEDSTVPPVAEGAPKLVAVPTDPTVPSTATEPEPAHTPVAEELPPVADAVMGPGDATWVAAVEGACPDGYPIKAKVKSGIYHVPGTPTYERTKPDRCYPSVEAAQADGLRPPKR